MQEFFCKFIEVFISSLIFEVIPGSTPGSKDGNWHNPKTGESLRPDLNHPNPIGPHWDYKDPSGKWWRIFSDGTNVPK